MARGRLKPPADAPRQLRKAKADGNEEFKLPDYLQELLLESQEWQNFGQEDNLLVQVVGSDSGKDVADGAAGGAPPAHPQESKDAAGATAQPSGSAHGAHRGDLSHRGSVDKHADGKGGSEHTACKRQAWLPEFMPQHYSSDLLWQHPPVMVCASQFRWEVSDEGRLPVPLRPDLAPQELSISVEEDQRDSCHDASSTLKRLLGEYYNPLASVSVREASTSYMRSLHESSMDSADEDYDFYYRQPPAALDGRSPPFAEAPAWDERALSPLVTRPPLARQRTLPGGQVSPEAQLLQRRASLARRASLDRRTPPAHTPRPPPRAPAASPRRSRRARGPPGGAAAAAPAPAAGGRALVGGGESPIAWLSVQAPASRLSSPSCASPAGAASPSPKAFGDRVVHELASQLAVAPAVRAVQSPRPPPARTSTPCPRPSPAATPLPARPLARSPVPCGVASPSCGRAASRAGMADRLQQPLMDSWRATPEGMPRRPHSVATTAPYV